MLVGFLGDIPFLASASVLRTFDEYARGSTARWHKHDLIGQKPVLEYLGPDVEKISLKMLLRADKGINPAQELDRLRELRDTGEVLPLIIGGRPIGKNFWVIESLDESVKYWTRFGHIFTAEVTVSLQEYVERQVLM